MESNIKNLFTASLLHFSAIALTGCSAGGSNMMGDDELSNPNPVAKPIDIVPDIKASGSVVNNLPDLISNTGAVDDPIGIAPSVNRNLVRKVASSYVRHHATPVVRRYARRIAGDHVGNMIAHRVGDTIGNYAGDIIDGYAGATIDGYDDTIIGNYIGAIIDNYADTIIDDDYARDYVEVIASSTNNGVGEYNELIIVDDTDTDGFTCLNLKRFHCVDGSDDAGEFVLIEEQTDTNADQAK